MTVADLEQHVWRRLGVRKFVAGRETVRELVELSIANWEPQMFAACVDDDQRDAVCNAVADNVRRAHQVVAMKEPQEYGFIWVFLLQALASAIIQIILRWWLTSASNRQNLVAWQEEMTGKP